MQDLNPHQKVRSLPSYPLDESPLVGETGFEPANPLGPGQVLYQTELLSDFYKWMREDSNLLSR